MPGNKPLRCSFCGKDESQVARLVAGPDVFICNVCVAAAKRIMESGGDTGLPVLTPPDFK